MNTDRQTKRQQNRQRLGWTNGSVLLSVLGFLVSMSILISLFALMSKSILDVVFMEQSADTAYYLARSETNIVLNKLSRGEVSAGYRREIESPDIQGKSGDIQVRIDNASDVGVVRVLVQASQGKAFHTISFQYNLLKRKIVQWTDSDLRITVK
ncbi:hypothetical protein [Alicyclobacillus sp. SO9]|uniref:hypothetical protein n=1 Tax=Alicyclobacillus sp. SO9 TaxID=2665646 RepID=UPI0018E853BC|nr:hypothetical protein [Alicyclobacillus sp. SO9]QQE76990.1 hypothetical protein GI364_13445 [Alicyclobacillus sp. SO9]